MAKQPFPFTLANLPGGNNPVANIDSNFNVCMRGPVSTVLGNVGYWDDTAGTSQNAGYPTTPAFGTIAKVVGVDASNKLPSVDASNLTNIPAGLIRSYLAGLKLTAAGGVNNFGVAVGVAADDTNAVMLSLGSALNKTTAAWSAGNNGGSLDTGAIAANTWYHVYLIGTANGATIDVLTSLSVSAPTLPASYTLKRRIGSMKTDGSNFWLGFTQDGDYFRLNASILDLNATNPGAAAVLTPVSAPPGVNAKWLGNAFLRTNTTNTALYLSDPSANDEAPSNTSTAAPAVPGATLSANASNSSQYTQAEIRTNTSAQIRYRLAASGTDVVVGLITLGWTDPRGRNN